MTRFAFPAGTVLTDGAHPVAGCRVRQSSRQPHETKHDGHRLTAIVADGAVKLLRRNACDRTELLPDARGIAHIDALTEAMRLRGARSLPRSARVPDWDRKALLRDIVGAAGGPASRHGR